MDRLFHLRIATHDSLVLDETVRAVSIKTSMGARGILYNHENFSGTIVDNSVVTIEFEDGKEEYVVIEGNLLFRRNDCLIIAEFAAKTSEAKRLLEERRQRLEQLYKEELEGGHEIQRAQMTIQRTLIRGSSQQEQ